MGSAPTDKRYSIVSACAVWLPVVGVRRVVKGFGSAAILRAAIRPVRNEEFRDRTPKRGGSHVEGRVAGVKVVSDFAEKEV